MKKNRQFSLLLVTIFFLIAFSGLMSAYTISSSTANIERRYGISNVVKIGSILYTAIPVVSGSYEQIKLFNSSDGGITWSNAYGTSAITSDNYNKTLSKSLVVNGKIYIFYLKPAGSTNYFKVFDVTTGNLSSEYLIDFAGAIIQDYDIIFADNGYIYIADADNSMRIGEIRISDNTLIYSNNMAFTGGFSKTIHMMQDSTGDIYIVAVGNDGTGLLKTIISSDYGRTLIQSNYFITGSNYFLRAGIDDYDTIYEIYSKAGTPNTLELYYKNLSGAWTYGLTNITNFDYLHYPQDSSNDMFFLNGSFYFNYMDTDGNFSLGYYDKGTSRLQKAVFSNNLYFGGNIRSKEKSGVNPSTIDIIVGNFSNGYMVNPFEYSFLSLNPSTFLEGISGGGGEEGIQGGGAGYFCAFYRYYFDWLNLNDYCLFADSFDYSRNVSLSAYLNGVDYYVANGTLASSNGWNYSTKCDISNHPVPSYFSQSIKDGAGGITEGSDICQNETYYEGAITRTFDVPINLQNKGIFKMVARVILEPLKGAKAIIEIGKSIPSQTLMATGTILVIGINDSNGNAFIWYSDGNNWLRASSNTKCDLYFSNTSQYSTFEVRLDLNTKKFDISSVGSVYCDRNFSAPNSAVIGSGLRMFESPMNYLDEVRWYINPDIYGNPEGMTPTFPYLYDVGLSDLVISKVLGDVTLETCDYGRMVQTRCNCGNEVAEIGQWCCYEYNTTSFWVFNEYDYQYCGGIDTCRTNVKSEDICLCNGQYNYGRWCCYSVAYGYYIGDFNSTFCGGGTVIGGGDNITITPYINSTIGDSIATLLGLTSPNLKIVGTLLFLMAGIFGIILLLTSSKIEGNAIVFVPSIFVVLGIIFFFVIGWIPFWILFILVIICAGIFGLFIKSTFGSNTGG